MDIDDFEIFKKHVNSDGVISIKSKFIKKELIKIISELPQIKHIELDHAENWVTKLVESPIKRLFGEKHILWHAKRLNGIGGSEIGCVIGHLFNYINPFKTRQEIIMDKLMMIPPIKFSADTLRGNLLEKLFEDSSVERLTLNTKGFKRINESDVQDIIKASGMQEKYPWLVGNPDFVYMINNRMFIDDFKIPRTDLALEYAEKGKLPFNYVAQIHHYAMCLGKASKHVKMGLLSYNFGLGEPLLTGMIDRAIGMGQYENIEANINELGDHIMESERTTGIDNPYGANLHRQNIPVSPVICEAILNEGTQLWNHIMTGYSAAMEFERDYLGDKSEFVIETPEFVDRANLIALKRKSADMIYAESKADATKLSDELKDMSDRRIKLGNVTLSAPTKSKKITDKIKAMTLIRKYHIPMVNISSIDDKKLVEQLTNAMGERALLKSGVIYEVKGSRAMRFPIKTSCVYKNEIEPIIKEIKSEYDMKFDQLTQVNRVTAEFDLDGDAFTSLVNFS